MNASGLAALDLFKWYVCTCVFSAVKSTNGDEKCMILLQFLTSFVQNKFIRIFKDK